MKIKNSSQSGTRGLHQGPVGFTKWAPRMAFGTRGLHQVRTNRWGRGLRNGGSDRNVSMLRRLPGLLPFQRGGRSNGKNNMETKMCILVFLCVGPVFGQSWAQKPAQRPRLEKRYINQRELSREIDSKAPWWPFQWAYKYIFFSRPRPREPPKSAGNGSPGPPLTVLGNHWRVARGTHFDARLHFGGL